MRRRDLVKLPFTSKLVTGLVLVAFLGGCASPPEPKPENKPEQPAKDPGEVPAGNPRAPNVEKPKPQRPQAQHPPDDEKPGGGGNQGGGGNLLDEIHRDLTLRDKEKAALADHYFKV